MLEYNTKDFNNIKNFTKRINEIKKYVNQLIKEKQPEIISIEDIQFQKNPKTFRELAELKGVLENLLYEKEYLYFIISPSLWKSTCEIKGRKRIDQKINSQKFVKEKFGLNVDEDIADAICIGYHVSKKIIHKIIKA